MPTNVRIIMSELPISRPIVLVTTSTLILQSSFLAGVGSGSLIFGPQESGSVIIFTDPDLDPDPSISKQKNENQDFQCFAT
jgi:hypothetical protein